MDTAVVNAGNGRKHKFDRECTVLAAGLLMILLILSRYIVNGEPVDVRSDETEIGIELPIHDDIEIHQPLVIIEEIYGQAPL